jgi:hypothetical protein
MIRFIFLALVLMVFFFLYMKEVSDHEDRLFEQYCVQHIDPVCDWRLQ